jgi:hypothetical protein
LRAYAEPDALPTKIRRMLKVQCDGEWERVTVDDDGAFIVHNNAAQARRFVGVGPPATKAAPPKKTAPRKATSAPSKALPKAAPPKAAPRKVAPPPQKQAPAASAPPPPKQQAPVRPAPESGPTLAQLLQQRPIEEKDSQGVAVVSVPEEEKLQRSELQKMVWSDARGEADWDSIDPEATAYQLQQRLQKGLPQWMRFQYHPDVLSLWGMDLGLMSDALRWPSRVEVRPQTKEKRYPILAFYRGDLEVILGLRQPYTPAVIAAYAGTRLQPGGNSNGGGGSGGGGAKRQSGLPNTVKASLRALRSRGCEIDFEPNTIDQATVDVIYKGQNLGKINVAERTGKQQVQSDYQRTLRKINAIDQRQGAAV